MITWWTAKVGLFVAGILASSLAALGLAYAWQGQKLKTAEARVEKAANVIEIQKFQIATAEAMRDNFRKAALNCTNGVEALKADSVKRQAEAENRAQAARREAERYAASLKRIAALQAAPTPSGAGCQQGLAELRKELHP